VLLLLTSPLGSCYAYENFICLQNVDGESVRPIMCREPMDRCESDIMVYAEHSRVAVLNAAEACASRV
jgi:hypothetical protein